jgi:SAM-dependent methyltransferase
MQGINAFDQHALEYDRWFDEHDLLYQSEVNALRKCIPREGTGIEIGLGSGRFSTPFDIRLGVEPSRAMARIAHKRGIAVTQALGEQLPFREDQFDFILLVTVICFVNNVPTLLQEVRRVLKPGGRMILAFIDRDSQLGQAYEARKMNDQFYKVAHFYSVAEVTKYVQRAGFGVPRH